MRHAECSERRHDFEMGPRGDYKNRSFVARRPWWRRRRRRERYAPEPVPFPTNGSDGVPRHSATSQERSTRIAPTMKPCGSSCSAGMR